MSKFNKGIVFLTWLVVANYCVHSFIIMDFNPINWPTGARIALVFTAAASIAFGCLAIDDLFKDDK